MVRKFRIIYFIIVLIFLFLISTFQVFAIKPTIIEGKYKNNAFDIKETDNIIINGKVNYLYPVYIDSELALSKIKLDKSELINILKSKYGLNDLTFSNWKDYMTAALCFSDDYPKLSENFTSDIIDIQKFFDIYENKEKNAEIIKAYDNLTSDMYIACDVQNMVLGDYTYNIKYKTEMEDIGYKLPYNSIYYRELESRDMLLARPTYNVNSALNYANRYATKPNKSTYHYFHRGDCANFASQILENSGVRQVVTNSVATGWWHKRQKKTFGYKHTHSQSWTLADTFSRYQGVVYSTRNNTQFRNNISKGSFVALDFGSDGDWDHCGFVTDKNSKDYKIAQHTTNYNEWTSSSKNNWEIYGSKGAKYARLRN